MNLIECDNLQVVPDRLYGGATGSKIAVEYNGSVWLLKVCERLHDKKLKNVELSYANDPITEYIGYHIYEIFGFHVHNTLLGMFKNRLCVLCSDDAYPCRLFEFREFRNAIFADDVVQPSSGMSTSLSDIMQVIALSDKLPKEDALKRFWQMFVIDSLIGNTDRNNGNWAFLFEEGRFIPYEVYDCGRCLNNKRSDEQMQNDIVSDNAKNLALQYTFNFKDERGKRINPFQYIEKHPNDTILKTLNLFNEDILQRINELIDSLIPIISAVRATWYKEILRLRFDYLVHMRDNILDSSTPNKIEL